jgi:ankyrin repeat protein
LLINISSKFLKSTFFFSQEGYLEIVKLLVNKGADVNVKTVNSIVKKRGKNYGDTALIWASINGFDKVVKFLLENNANPNIQNDGGNTALIFAANEGHKKVVKILLDNDVEVETKTKNGDTALSKATEKGHKEIVKMLEDKIKKIYEKTG